MARNSKAAVRRSLCSSNSRQVLGLGFLPAEARHGFLIDVPSGTGRNDWIRIVEYRSGGTMQQVPVSHLDIADNDSSLRVLIDRNRWAGLAPVFWEEANRRLRANGLAICKFQKSPSKPVPVHPSLGKELCVLCWAVEEAQPELIPNALLNWEALAPEERWWLYTMTVATAGQALRRGVGWRKALRNALAENPFVKGEGVPARSRRELLSHTQQSLGFD